MVPGAIKKIKKEWLEERVATLVWMVREGLSEEVMLELSRIDERSNCQGKLATVF